MVPILKLVGSLHHSCFTCSGVDHPFLSLSLPPISLIQDDRATLLNLGEDHDIACPGRELKNTSDSLEKLCLTGHSSSHSEGVRLNFVFYSAKNSREKSSNPARERKSQGSTEDDRVALAKSVTTDECAQRCLLCCQQQKKHQAS